MPILRPCRAAADRIIRHAVLGALILALALGVGSASAAQEYSLRVFGNGSGAPGQDRVTIRIDAPAVPADIGAGDFTLEWWMKVGAGNTSGGCVAGSDGWINGNIVLDRDVFGAGDYGDFGVSLFGAGGRLAFGVDVGGSGNTICGATDVADGAWHHVAVTRRASDGEIRVFVDGQPDARGAGPTGDASYRDGRATSYPSSDPFLVIGAEKHDAGPAYPSFSGWIDEVRLSETLRYTSAFSPPTGAFVADANTAALYHFDEGPAGPCTGTVADASGAAGGPSTGTCEYGGSPAGPLYSTDTPFASPPPPLCGAAPVPSGCRAAGRSAVRIANGSDPSRDKLVWKWLKGDATGPSDFGDPVNGSTDYALCAYDATTGPGTLLLSATAAPGVGWKAPGDSRRFSDRDAPGGLSKLVLKSGGPGAAKVVAKGKGTQLGVPPLSLPPNPTVVVQLLNREGVCWAATFTDPIENSASTFKAKND